MEKSKMNFHIAREIIAVFKLLLLALLFSIISIFYFGLDGIQGYLLKRDYEIAKEKNQDLISVQNKILARYRPAFLNYKGTIVLPNGEIVDAENVQSENGCIHAEYVSETELKQVVNYDCLVNQYESSFSRDNFVKYFKVFYLSFILMLVIRYSVRGIRWVLKNSKE